MTYYVELDQARAKAGRGTSDTISTHHHAGATNNAIESINALHPEGDEYSVMSYIKGEDPSYYVVESDWPIPFLENEENQSEPNTIVKIGSFHQSNYIISIRPVRYNKDPYLGGEERGTDPDQSNHAVGG